MIRVANLQDSAALTALWNEAFIDGPVRARPDRFTDTEVAHTIMRGECFTVVERGEILATAVLAANGSFPANLTESDDDAQIVLVAVAEKARRRGFGRLVVSAAVAGAGGHGVRRVWLWSRPEQVEAHQLYRSLGFQRMPLLDQPPENPEKLVFLLGLHDTE